MLAFISCFPIRFAASKMLRRFVQHGGVRAIHKRSPTTYHLLLCDVGSGTEKVRARFEKLADAHSALCGAGIWPTGHAMVLIVGLNLSRRGVPLVVVCPSHLFNPCDTRAMPHDRQMREA